MCSLQANEKMRYKDLMKCIPDISHKMLTHSLKKPEKDHLLTRKTYAEIPPSVEYSLNQMGESIMPAIQIMIEWAQIHFEAVAM
jgi:DNA-binding HxlR family transcriptional regulator